MKKFLFFWVPVLVWAVIILLISSIPSSRLPEIKLFFLDKIVHFSEYFVFSALMARAFSGASKLNYKRYFVISLSFAAVFALLDEIHQIFLPTRSFDLLDLFFDLLGAFAGLIVYEKLKALLKEEVSISE
ncbi:VanZ family protein [bacterium]|jgi:VanZ family protein|nr:VanZ family protein [bacterium]